jgi:hypothetical protein
VDLPLATTCALDIGAFVLASTTLPVSLTNFGASAFILTNPTSSTALSLSSIALTVAI